jgi:selenium metabolism protein YedF
MIPEPTTGGPSARVRIPRPPETVVFVTAETLGRGDDALGAKLMSVFLDTLGQFAPGLTHLICINGAARLVIDDSPVLGQLTALEQVGVQVLTCGTCLDHFGIRARLAVGSASNMAAILELLTRAARVIQP